MGGVLKGCASGSYRLQIWGLGFRYEDTQGLWVSVCNLWDLESF